ncbi:Cof-type HAD-IIB family hydrolase [Lapidilactobacillus mulanensis]|uniref:Cof-type HAD-IIB family hydrolase n=1 Tax=Lapidilactobacillus mulanensis TaxID=2485999 RepID=A0ABW4DSL9_9LACO|nr:Cof-type HAD-IIB family hydrolase [Lapidilactobacillus mulanensis]
MSIKLVAIDIDDTLLNSNHQLLASTKTSIQQALAAGVKVVLCSGRPLAGVKPFLDELGIEGDQQYVITFNGSVIESVSGQVLAQSGISRETYQAIDDYSQKYHLSYNVLDSQSRIYTSNLEVDPITVIQARENEAGVFIRKPAELPADVTLIKAVFGGTAVELDQNETRVQQMFGKTNYVVRAAARFLEVMHRDVNKGKALARLAAVLNLEASEIMAIGDEQNDITMFDYAGTAVVMANGSELAKKHADFETRSNDEDGIAFALEKYITQA